MLSDLVFGDNSDKRFYGIYRGICVNSEDPLKKGRITLQIPQILGTVVTDWAWPIVGGLTQGAAPYGTFSSMTNVYQGGTTTNLGVVSTATPIKLEITEDANGPYTDPTDRSKIYVNETADYFFEFSGQAAKGGGASAQIDLWIRKNGVDIPRSNSRYTLQGNPNEVLVTVAFILDLKAGDYVQVMFSSASADAHLVAYSGLTVPTRPDIPSIIATINAIGKHIPQPGSGVWVMFEGGDPNFPLWMGEF